MMAMAAAMAAMMIPMGFAVIAALSAFCAPVATAVAFAHPACASWDTVTCFVKRATRTSFSLRVPLKAACAMLAFLVLIANSFSCTCAI